MPGDPSDLDHEGRYEYFLSRVARTGHVWLLRSPDDEWAIVTDDDGTEVLPVWPDEHDAAAAATGIWAGDEPTMLPVDLWLEALEHEALVFPDNENLGARASQGRLLLDLKRVLEQF
jgi:uncharacterized protein DUF2750